MLYITGVAQVLPINFINKQDFAAIGILHSVSVAIPSALNKEYLLTSKNISPKEGMNNMCQSPTDLGEQAVKLAVTNSSTAIEEIGLLIGDTSTPFENIPTEGQRIASRFGIKIPCYDILGSSGFIPLVLETLNNFKEEKLPKKIIAVTSSTATQAIDYSACNNLAASHLGDAALSMVVSKTPNSKCLKVLHAKFYREPTLKTGFECDNYEPILLTNEFLEKSCKYGSAVVNCIKEKFNISNVYSSTIAGGRETDLFGGTFGDKITELLNSTSKDAAGFVYIGPGGIIGELVLEKI